MERYIYQTFDWVVQIIVLFVKTESVYHFSILFLIPLDPCSNLTLSVTFYLSFFLVTHITFHSIIRIEAQYTKKVKMTLIGLKYPCNLTSIVIGYMLMGWLHRFGTDWN